MLLGIKLDFVSTGKGSNSVKAPGPLVAEQSFMVVYKFKKSSTKSDILLDDGHHWKRNEHMGNPISVFE